MAILKLTESGSSLTMHCAKCEVVQGNYDEQVKFTDTRGDQLFLPRKSADRQLFRCGFGTEDAPGEYNIHYSEVDGTTLVFSRDPNAKMPTKPFWGIRKIADNDAPRAPLTERAKAEAERVRKAKGLPPEEDGNLGPHIPGLDDAPPPSDEDYPYDDDGLPPVKAATAPQSQSKAEQYFALARQVADFQAEIGNAKECPFDLASINAMTFSIWNSR